MSNKKTVWSTVAGILSSVLACPFLRVFLQHAESELRSFRSSPSIGVGLSALP